MITPTTSACIYDFNDKPITVPLITLTAYAIALKGLLKTGYDVTGQGIEAKARKLLSAPTNYPLNLMTDHLQKCLEQTQEHYGISKGLCLSHKSYQGLGIYLGYKASYRRDEMGRWGIDYDTVVAELMEQGIIVKGRIVRSKAEAAFSAKFPDINPSQTHHYISSSDLL
tara:strand:+ start:2507 stop:3013 length:507 start_codon:yes stop_codon:yes gene_type:complete